MSLSYMLPWFGVFLVLMVVLMFLVRHLLKAKDLPVKSASVDDVPGKS